MLYHLYRGDSIRKDIPGFSKYCIDERGNIYNKDAPDHPLSSWVDGTGYRTVVLYRDKKRCYQRVHRLMGQTYLPNPTNLPQINHKDGNKLNNNLWNLEWASNAANTQHGYDNNLYKSTTHCPVMATPLNGDPPMLFSSIRSMSEELGINRKTVTEILKGRKLTNNYPYRFQYFDPQ